MRVVFGGWLILSDCGGSGFGICNGIGWNWMIFDGLGWIGWIGKSLPGNCPLN